MARHADARGSLASPTEVQVTGYNVWRNDRLLFDTPVDLETALAAMERLKAEKGNRRVVVVHTTHEVLGDDAEAIRYLLADEVH